MSDPAPAMTIVVDTREQHPYSFEGICPVARAALPAGDYSIAGCELVFAIERKSLADLVSTIIGNRARFVRELERLRLYQFSAILVEGTVRDVLEFHSDHWRGLSEAQRRARPRTVINSLNSWQIEYSVRVLFVDRDRDLCRAQVYRLAERFWRARQVERAAAAGPAGAA